MYRVELGDLDRARRHLAGTFRIEIPKLGDECVCCNGDPAGRTIHYDPSADRLRADPFPVPVCAECAGHATRTPVAKTWQQALLVAGVGAAVLGQFYRADHPGTRWLVAVIVAGAVMTAVAVCWMAWHAWTARRRIGSVHHPWLTITVARGCTTVATNNGALVERLLARHRDARVVGPAPPRATAR